jgi:hypothetical protein
MSSPLAIAAVTAAIKDLLNDGLLNNDLSSIGSFTVTSLPPDRISTGQTEPNQLNVFLYQITPNSGWRNAMLPSRDSGGTRLSNPPLALDLHFLVTAYGAEDLNAEVLLGYAMQLLHDTPVLTRQQLRTVLGGVNPVDGTILPSPFGNMSAADLADQIELIKITPVFLNTEDLSKLWTSMQARYRPSMAYMASVVLMQSSASTRSAPPVLKRGPDDRGPVALATPFASLNTARAAASDLMPALRIGEQIRLVGSNLTSDGTTIVVLEHAATGAVNELLPDSPPTANELLVTIPGVIDDPNAMNLWQPGVYNISLRIERPNVPNYVTNSVPIALSPWIEIAPLAAAPGNFTLTIRSMPRLSPQQESRALLVFGTTTITPATVTNPADLLQPTTLTFSLTGVAPGQHIVRLRVEGIDSIPVTLTGSPPKFDFDPLQRVTVT